MASPRGSPQVQTPRGNGVDANVRRVEHQLDGLGGVYWATNYKRDLAVPGQLVTVY